MTKYTVNVSWTMVGSYDIEAESLAEALTSAQASEVFPKDQEYVDSSFEVEEISEQVT